jgi:Putative prokaryotic signal transducing protein
MSDGASREIDWVELLRVYDRFEAEITVDMLEDHDVPVRTYGGATTALPAIGLTDVRILVPRAEQNRAEQVLAAMRDGRADVHPFRDAPPEPYDAPVRRRLGLQFAWAMLALALAYATAALVRH